MTVPLAPLLRSTPVSDSIGMSNLPDFSSWTGPASSGSVSESGGGNWEMSTFVPVEALAGIRLHPGPGPIGPGPGPFSIRGPSSADAATEKSAAASAANAMPPRHRRGRFTSGNARAASPGSDAPSTANEK